MKYLWLSVALALVFLTTSQVFVAHDWGNRLYFAILALIWIAIVIMEVKKLWGRKRGGFSMDISPTDMITKELLENIVILAMKAGITPEEFADKKRDQKAINAFLLEVNKVQTARLLQDLPPEMREIGLRLREVVRVAEDQHNEAYKPVPCHNPDTDTPTSSLQNGPEDGTASAIGIQPFSPSRTSHHGSSAKSPRKSVSGSRHPSSRKAKDSR